MGKVLRTAARLAALALAASLLVALYLVVDGLTDDVEGADVAVVLGAKVFESGVPAGRLRARLDRALGLYEAEVVEAVIVSGAVGREGHDESLVMRDYLVERGVPADVILVDGGGVNTYATARYAAAAMDERGWESAVVVTQYFHVPRARLALRRFGVEEVYGAHAPYFGLRDLYSIPREVVALGWYGVRSY